MAAATRFRVTLPIRWADSDRLGHVNNTKIVEYAQEARVAFARSFAGAGAPSAMVVRRVEIDFLRPIMDDSGPLTVELSVTRIGTTSFSVRHDIVDNTGAVCATAHAVMVAFDVHTDEARPLGDEFRAAISEYVDEESAA